MFAFYCLFFFMHLRVFDLWTVIENGGRRVYTATVGSL